MKLISLVFLVLFIGCGKDDDVVYGDPGYSNPAPPTVVYAPGHHGGGHGGHRWPTPPRWGGHRPGGRGPGHGGPGGGHGGGGHGGGGHHLMNATITEDICNGYEGETYENCMEGFRDNRTN